MPNSGEEHSLLLHEDHKLENNLIIPVQASDDLITINDSIIQHGPLNDRVYVMKLGEQNLVETLQQVEELAQDCQYGKIFIKSSEITTPELEQRQYICEAEIPNFYHGQDDAHFMVKYLSNERQQASNEQEIADILQASIDKQLQLEQNIQNPTPEGFQLRRLEKSDSEEMALIYQEVFETYPFPIHDPNYIQNAMDTNVEAYGIFDRSKLVALASCEMDFKAQNVEMTDFATLPEYRGKNIAQKLLKFMEKQMCTAGMKTAYTIARAHSFGMNITFSKRRYKFGGTLINNTNISGSIESMNVWYKNLKV